MMDEKVKIIKATKALQQKAGLGNLDEKLVQEAQKVINESTVDFVSLARPQLSLLQEATSACLKKGAALDELAMESIKTPIMNIKANAATFNYPSVSKISETVLLFLESQPKLDRKMVLIVSLLHKTLLLMLARKMSGDGGAEGQALHIAFAEVCRKYQKKKAAAKK